jgi:hypothetical protein
VLSMLLLHLSIFRANFWSRRLGAQPSADLLRTARIIITRAIANDDLEIMFRRRPPLGPAPLQEVADDAVIRHPVQHPH